MIKWAHHRDGAEYDAAVSFIANMVWGGDVALSPGTVMSVRKGGERIAACLFHNYYPDTGVIEMSAASVSPRCLSRIALNELFGYAFDEMKCQAVVLRVDARNSKMCDIAARVGFCRCDVPRMRGRGLAEAVFVLGDDDWRNGKFYKGAANGI